MTNKPFDKFNKRVFQELLSPCGQVFPEFGILGEGRRIDVFFAPCPGVVTDVSELGYLALGSLLCWSLFVVLYWMKMFMTA
jgi:hypothetical protein